MPANAPHASEQISVGTGEVCHTPSPYAANWKFPSFSVKLRLVIDDRAANA